MKGFPRVARTPLRGRALQFLDLVLFRLGLVVGVGGGRVPTRNLGPALNPVPRALHPLRSVAYWNRIIVASIAKFEVAIRLAQNPCHQQNPQAVRDRQHQVDGIEHAQHIAVLVLRACVTSGGQITMVTLGRNAIADCAP